MSYYTRRQSTVQQVETTAARIQAQFPGFTVQPNGYGWRMECNRCHNSRCHDTSWAYSHTC